MRIAWLGTGLLGGAMARRLLEHGRPLVVWNRTAAHAASLAEQGAALASSPAAAVHEADLVVTVLRDGPVTAAVLLGGDEPPALAGKLVVQMGTIAPEESRRLARAIAGARGRYLEAPVLGSRPQAAAGRLLVFAGGEARDFERARPLFEPLAGEIVHVGPVGAAATLKLAFNQLIATEISGFTLALALVRASSVDVETFMTLLRQSAFHAVAYDGRLARFLARDYERPSFTLELLGKDVALAREEAARLGLGTEAIAGVEALVARALERPEFAQLDYGALYEAIDPAR